MQKLSHTTPALKDHWRQKEGEKNISVGLQSPSSDPAGAELSVWGCSAMQP